MSLARNLVNMARGVTEAIGTIVIHIEHEELLKTIRLPGCLYVPGLSFAFLCLWDLEQVIKSDVVWMNYRYYPHMVNGETIFEPVACSGSRSCRKRKKDKIINPKASIQSQQQQQWLKFLVQKRGTAYVDPDLEYIGIALGAHLVSLALSSWWHALLSFVQ